MYKEQNKYGEKGKEWDKKFFFQNVFFVLFWNVRVFYLGFYVCRVHAAESPSTEAAVPSAAAEEANSKHFQSPTYNI